LTIRLGIFLRHPHERSRVRKQTRSKRVTAFQHVKRKIELAQLRLGGIDAFISLLVRTQIRPFAQIMSELLFFFLLPIDQITLQRRKSWTRSLQAVLHAK